MEAAVEKRIEIKKWNAVALWSWKIQVDTCAICKVNLMEPCIECQANQNSQAASECFISWGVCNHAYHGHCITRWVKTKNTCPLDNREWVPQKMGK